MKKSEVLGLGYSRFWPSASSIFELAIFLNFYVVSVVYWVGRWDAEVENG